ncbi:hypothetical protein ESZ53_06105 [Salinibacterium sp. UTAS2018]|uniref:hypothetical protein n=1 Tax=Salinibacterium sp. UTAS2018 TaxID=2508880 RepID=UPI0010095280|nr:hypothetical protein [Salinibacterium sp. UTAS2018]QAV70045.1 hypothetical protein ESZ53_06105 [Salinibacterium sp. UTAS2018]
MNSRHTAFRMGGLAFVVLVLAGCSLLDPQGQLTLHDLVNVEEGVDVTTQAEDITDTACATLIDCVEAYSTAEANYYRFDSRDDAEAFGSSVEDGFVINYIVMDFAGKDASVQEQLHAMQMLAGMWNDYEGGFPDRG